MLNVVNGILFIQIREKDLEAIRDELEKQTIDDQQAAAAAAAAGTTQAKPAVSNAAELAAALMNNEVD